MSEATDGSAEVGILLSIVMASAGHISSQTPQ